MSSNVLLLEKALNGKLIIPGFHTFKEAINSIFYECLSIYGGKVTDIIIRATPLLINLFFSFFRMRLTSLNYPVLTPSYGVSLSAQWMDKGEIFIKCKWWP